jgi:cell wall-associated NlpC family hydrolase
MLSLKNNRFGKIIVSACLSATFIFSAGSMIGTYSTAYAASTISDSSVANSSVASQIIALGLQYQGVKYQFGTKSGMTSAFDCSSFTQYVYKKNGVNLPRSSLQQSRVGTYVPRSQLRAGDLIFSDTNRDGVVNHVSIYMGNNQLLHTYRVGIGVTVSKFSGSAWDRGYMTARRVL